jgi:2-aminoadipate transaminase
MFTWLTFHDDISTDALLVEALKAGAAFVPGSAFSIEEGNRSALRLCFATVEESQLVEGVNRLATAYQRLRDEH